MQENNNFSFNDGNNGSNQNNENNSYNYNGQNSYNYNAQNSSNSQSDHSQNFSQNNGEPINFDNFQPPKKSKNWAAIIFTAIGAVLLSVLFSYFFFSALNRSVGTTNTDIGDENLTIIQNSPKVELVQNTDVDYEPKSISEVVLKIGDSVVEISTASVSTNGFFNQYVTSGAGSGVIITQSEEAGYLLTNHHVIDGAKEITVRLTNGDEYAAQILGSDSTNDLAVLRIEKKSGEIFTVAPLGDSSKLVVGQDVIAIGNPLGSLGGTVTDGIISALDRTVTIDGVSMVLLQHNAAINPGNSGGGLFDAMGNLIGIVNAKTSEAGIEGLGFAIPINIAHNFFNRVMVTEPALGIQVDYAVMNRVVGMYVVNATESSKFEKYDRIVSVNGKTISTEADYSEAVGALKMNETVTFVVERDRKNVEIKILLQ